MCFWRKEYVFIQKGVFSEKDVLWTLEKRCGREKDNIFVDSIQKQNIIPDSGSQGTNISTRSRPKAKLIAQVPFCRGVTWDDYLENKWSESNVASVQTSL